MLNKIGQIIRFFLSLVDPVSNDKYYEIKGMSLGAVSEGLKKRTNVN